MLCVRLPKVGKRPQVKRPLNGEQTLRWVTVESRGRAEAERLGPRLRAGEYHLAAGVPRHCYLSV